MLTVQVNLLTGRYAATAYNDRKQAEWPPHPGRFYAALVAALHECDPVAQEEREVLLWLEQQAPPSLDVDLTITQTVGRRQVLDVFVPVNDVTLIGDIEAPVRTAREAASQEKAPCPIQTESKQRAAALATLKTEEEKLNRFLEDQLIPLDHPKKTTIATASALLPDRRIRQVRTFPVIVPSNPRFHFIWNATLPDQLKPGLDRLCARVTRLGHSSSLVHCLRIEQTMAPTLVPHPRGTISLRVPGTGHLTRLERAFEQHQGVNQRVLPSQHQLYSIQKNGHDRPLFSQSVFSDDWIIFSRIGGSRPLSSLGPDIAQSLRKALLEIHGDTTLPESLSGHQLDGRPSEQPHIAFCALPYVGHPYADASIQGVAIILPRTLSHADKTLFQELIARWETLRAILPNNIMELATKSGQPVHVQRTVSSEKTSLQINTWCRPSRRFVTTTPIALDKHPGNLRKNSHNRGQRAAEEAQQIIATACERIGLPRPSRIDISHAPLLLGSQPLHDFGRWPRHLNRPAKVLVHAELEFPVAVQGPVILGAGRYSGLGLCLPIPEKDV